MFILVITVMCEKWLSFPTTYHNISSGSCSNDSLDLVTQTWKKKYMKKYVVRAEIWIKG